MNAILTRQKSGRVFLLPFSIKHASLTVYVFISDGSTKTVTDTLIPSAVMSASRSRILCFRVIPVPPVVTVSLRTAEGFEDMRKNPKSSHSTGCSPILSLTSSENETPANRASTRRRTVFSVSLILLSALSTISLPLFLDSS